LEVGGGGGKGRGREREGVGEEVEVGVGRGEGVRRSGWAGGGRWDGASSRESHLIIPLSLLRYSTRGPIGGFCRPLPEEPF